MPVYGSFPEIDFRKELVKLIKSTNYKKELFKSVAVSKNKTGILKINDKGNFIMQYMVKGPNESIDPNIRLDEDIKICPSCKKIVIVTHGWIDEAVSSWPADIAEQINSKTDPNQWVCGIFDWKGGAAVVNPVDAAKYAKNIAGPRLAKAVLNLPAEFKHIHFIGHSAGCWAISEAAKKIQKKTEAFIHLTFLDAFIPLWWDKKEISALKDKCFIEHYYTKDITLNSTHLDLPKALNVDISKLDRLLRDHEFPYRWYYATITGKYRKCDFDPDKKVINEYGGLNFGYQRSLEAGCDNWKDSLRLKGFEKTIEIDNPEKKNIFKFDFKNQKK